MMTQTGPRQQSCSEPGTAALLLRGHGNGPLGALSHRAVGPGTPMEPSLPSRLGPYVLGRGWRKPPSYRSQLSA